jgi:hypothetical protein
MVQHDTPSTPERTAALITAMMLRFAQEGLKTMGTDPLRGASQILPDGLQLTDPELLDWLEQAPKPLFVIPTYMRGMMAAWPGVSSPRATHNVKNQQLGIAERQQGHQLSDSTVVLFETGAETLSFPLSHLKVWAANYVAPVGWNLAPPQYGEPARVNLIAPGRRMSPGWRREGGGPVGDSFKQSK